jgi:hypothetical protein
MPQGSNRVHELRDHLRSAASHLDTGRFDEAAAEVEAALTIDPGSLAGQTLATRIESARTAAADIEADDLPLTDESGAGAAPVTIEPGRFVPPGVNAASWIGFEQRIQERRFGALLETARSAITRGDGIAARLALEEARELRSDDPRLDTLADEAALLPMAMPAGGADRVVWSRAAGAVFLLVVGVGLLIGFERMDQGPSIEVAPEALPAFTGPPETTDQLPAPVASGPGPDGTEPSATATSGPEMPDSPVTPVMPAPEPPVVVAAAVPVTSDASTGERRVTAAATAASPPARETRQAAGGSATNAPARGAVLARDEGSEGSRSGSTAPALIEETVDAVLPERPPILERPGPPEPRPSAAVSDAVRASAPPERPVRPEPAVATTPPLLTDAPDVVDRDLANAASAVAAAIVPRDESDVEQVLTRYARGYSQLDASGVREVWPSAPERALASAFAQLESQAISFDSCDIAVQGSRASASCLGSQSFVVLVGSRERRTEPRRWQFDLRRDGDAWKIHDAQVQRGR